MCILMNSQDKMDAQQRTHLLIGDEGLQSLSEKHVLIAGIGGVGSFAAEAVARAGIGHITLLDHDDIATSNINRQLYALHSTVDQAKVEVAKPRLLDINPALQLNISKTFISPDNIAQLLALHHYDFIIDCIDSISCKAALVYLSQQQGIPVISAMGAGGRLNPASVEISSLHKTHTCPLAREMRRQLRKLKGNLKYPVVFSTELPKKGSEHQAVSSKTNPGKSRSVNGTISYLPGQFGLMMAGYVIHHFVKITKNDIDVR